MKKKLTPQQHIRSLLAVSLRQDNNKDHDWQKDVIDYDAAFTQDELDVFNALEELCEGDFMQYPQKMITIFILVGSLEASMLRT